jgi:hypothetical protein
MKVCDRLQTAQTLAVLFGQPVLYISFYTPCDYEELLKAAPYLDPIEHSQVLYDGCGFIICEDEEELNKLFDQTVGDEGPTDTNPYKGPARVYALIINAKGETENENT